MDYPPIELDQRTFDCAGEGEIEIIRIEDVFALCVFITKKKKDYRHMFLIFSRIISVGGEGGCIFFLSS